MQLFNLVSDFKPTGDQPQAIASLEKEFYSDNKYQVLLGVTGSGKTFTIANLISRLQKPTLVISHNKTLAAQLYQEFRDFFPNNSVGFFVSYYDYYQPEAYIPQTDTYIEKETAVNEEIDKLRLEATTNLLTRKDVIVVASVSCIYNIGSPIEYGRYITPISLGQIIQIKDFIRDITDLQYTRSDYELRRSSFRIRGDTLEIWPAYQNDALRIQFLEDRVEKLVLINPVTGEPVDKDSDIKQFIIYPAKHYLTNPNTLIPAMKMIRKDLKVAVNIFEKQGKELETHRLNQKVEYDLEMIKEFGYVNGIENYSRYFDGRKQGEPPNTLLEYFRRCNPDYLTIIDESHISIPQIRGMYNGDHARKKTLIEYGFRLPSALDNRPLTFNEFLLKTNKIICASATPGNWERSQTVTITEQLIRPTGILDPDIEITKTKNQIKNLLAEIEKRVEKGERVLVTTLTKRMAETLSEYFENKNIKIHYLHSDIETLKRSDILDRLRLGEFDVVVGINLLREGLDLPEVSLVAILDADKEGFLRSETSLIQTMGRASRHINGKVIMYADKITDSMRKALAEVKRRRQIQINYNTRHGITPKSIEKPLRKKLVMQHPTSTEEKMVKVADGKYIDISNLDKSSLTPSQKKRYIKILNRKMNAAARMLDFEMAAKLRDAIHTLQDH